MASTTAVASFVQHDRSSLSPAGPWHKSAPRRVCRAYESERGWAAWCQHLDDRKVRPLARLLPSWPEPLFWSLPAGTDARGPSELAALLGQLARPGRRLQSAVEAAATAWLGLEANPASTDDTHGALGNAQRAVEILPDPIAWAIECLAWCGALSQLAPHLSERVWWSLLDRLAAVAGGDGAASDDPLTVQLLRGELPWALAYSFPELAICQALGDAARGTLGEGMAELLDGEGLPHCKHLHLLRPLLACWTRCGLVDQAIDATSIDHKQFVSMFEHALRLSRPNGQQVFTPASSPRWKPALIKAARQLAWSETSARRALLLAEKGGPRPKASSSKSRRKPVPSPSFEGEWAGLAVLRTHWTRSAPRLSVAYGGREVMSELSLGEKCLWSGPWTLDVRFNGRRLEILQDWEQISWESDDNVDYLEIEAQLADGVSVERHILLARHEGFALLADAVLGIQQGTIEYRGTLPLAPLAKFVGAVETREGLLSVGGRGCARVLPLALAEWRCGPTRGSLHAGTSGLELDQTAEAQSLFAPLFIDLSASRLRQETTWRQLTVAQSREIVPPEIAVGYRVQSSRAQWLVYRSLAAPEIRTVLGANLSNEFLVGRFPPQGPVETLLEIEAAK